MSVVNTIEKHRKKVGFTQEEFAQRIGVTRQTVIAIEKQNYTPSVALALACAKVFKVSVETLFSEK